MALSKTSDISERRKMSHFNTSIFFNAQQIKHHAGRPAGVKIVEGILGFKMSAPSDSRFMLLHGQFGPAWTHSCLGAFFPTGGF